MITHKKKVRAKDAFLSDSSHSISNKLAILSTLGDLFKCSLWA